MKSSLYKKLVESQIITRMEMKDLTDKSRNRKKKAAPDDGHTECS